MSDLKKNKFSKDVGKPISKVKHKEALANWKKTGIVTKCNFFGADVFTRLLSLPGAVGITIFHGMDDKGNMQPLLFATDVNGNTIVPPAPAGAVFALTDSDESDSGGYNASMTCPPHCPVTLT
jgi:hypothetical protein